jgi:hypothetical protein
VKPLLSIVALSLLLGSFVIASFQTLGVAATIPVGLGAAWAVWRVRNPRPDPEQRTHIKVSLDTPDDSE